MRDVSGLIKAYDVRGVVPDELDEALARDIGRCFGALIQPAAAIVIGHDMRESGPGLAAAFADGVMSQGIDVIRIGLASTDQLYFASGKLDVPGAMFTASHNPARYNGIKMCYAGAKPVGQDTGLNQIKDWITDGAIPEVAGATPGTARDQDMLTAYAQHLHSLVDISASRHLKVVVDAGNGMGGHTAPAVFKGLPLEIVPMYFELDGSFPNHEANPIEAANVADLRARVVAEKADIGLAFDGDADRCFVIDELGQIVSPSTITALVAARELRREPGSTIIYNCITSRAVPEIVRELGGTPVRTRVGHSFIKAEMARTGAIFGGEHSGHFYFRDFWKADSGMLAALHTLAALGEYDGSLSELLAQYSRYPSSGEINSTVDDPQGVIAQVEKHYTGSEGVTLDHLDGLTVSHDAWWFNLRASNTEPLLRLNVEADDRSTMERVRDEALALITKGATA
ncbi:MAG: phosphomannomutase/phosphoglucomutase [Actinomycetota bacterium]